MWNVKTEVFEGPLDLLLGLIEKRKLFINDISLSKVTDDYIAFIQNSTEISLGNRAHFILVASTLLLIKSKSLLPGINLTEEEEQSIDDLEDRLKEYKRIKELGVHLKSRFGKNMMFAKNPPKYINPVFSPEKHITLPNLLSALREVLNNLPKIENVPKAIVQKVISMEEMIERLTTRIKAGLKMSFSDFSGGKKAISREDRVHVIVGFLAMLELVKQGIISAHQESGKGDIHLETSEISLPSYGS